MRVQPQYIIDSNLRSLEMGLNPNEIPVFKDVFTSTELRRKLTEYEDVLVVVRFFVKKLLVALAGTPILIVISDDVGTILEMKGNATIKSMIEQLGIEVGVRFTEEACGTNVINLALSELHPIVAIGDDHYHDFFATSACYSAPFHYTDINNLLGTVSIMTTVDQADPFYLTLLTLMVDSIERELLLVKHNERLNVLNQIMIDSTRSGIVITDKEGIVIEFNEIAEKLTDLKKGLVLGNTVRQFKLMGQYISDVIEKGSKYENIQLVFERPELRGKFVCLFDALPIYNEHNTMIGAFGQFRDITPLYEAEEKNNYLAYHDDLTGLPNRRNFYKQMNEMMIEASEETDHYQLALLYIDLDRFKLVNDTMGHRGGDNLLQEAGRRIGECLGTNSKLARMGGDEFTIIVSLKDDPLAYRKIADLIMEKFNQPFIVEGQDFHISTSIGIAIYPDNGVDAETLLIHADTALYKAKEAGKNNYIVYAPSMNYFAHEKLSLENSLRKAVERNEWIIYYQPQIDLATGRLVGVEALIRWLNPISDKIISPSEFIPLAEETGLIIPIGEWVLREACLQNKKWQEAGFPKLRIAVNLSIAQFTKMNLVDTVKNVLQETGLSAEYLELEITETMTMNVERAWVILDQLNQLGVQISIDDFGTGYSSLNYLKRFPIHRLKIDRSFVQDITNDASDARIVGVIISMAHHLGLSVIAEGVETKQQLAFLVEHHCDEIQGFYFSEPLTKEALETKYFG